MEKQIVEQKLAYVAEGKRRMFERKKKRLAKFTVNRKEKMKRNNYCPCCGRSNDYYDY